MGKKITVDSATLFNKALEIIEAHCLFGLSPEKIEIVIHPQSIVHSLVEFCDGSTLAQLGPSDMRIPLQYAIFYPERLEGPAVGLDWGGIETLKFLPVDQEKFPSIKMAYRALKTGGTAPAVLAAADEFAVQLFLDGKIGFGEIFELVGLALEAHQPASSPTIDEVELAAEWGRQFLAEKVKVAV
jgi:1-deoxy-D-xylulose-5-phosphate reductoisomerase